jgi:YggT family protein
LIVFVEALINVVAGALTLALLVRTVFAWIPDARPVFLVRLAGDVTEPLLRQGRRLNPLFGGVDFSPLVALLAIQAAATVLLRLLPPAV